MLFKAVQGVVLMNLSPVNTISIITIILSEEYRKSKINTRILTGFVSI